MRSSGRRRSAHCESPTPRVCLQSVIVSTWRRTLEWSATRLVGVFSKHVKRACGAEFTTHDAHVFIHFRRFYFRNLQIRNPRPNL